jgi:Guanosine polyphosphate pyrophosphohydrolases/synthetases
VNKRTTKQHYFLKGFFLANSLHKSLNAMQLVEKYHAGERRDGAEEKSHLYEVANYVFSIMNGRVSNQKLDEIVASAFLHDLVEDYPDKYTEQELFVEFGLEVSNYTMSVTKPQDFQKVDEHYESYYQKVSRFPESIIIKFADRLHNFQTSLGGMSPERIKQYIEETEKYILPMAKAGRKEFPDYYFILTHLMRDMEKQIYFLKVIIKDYN